MTTARAGYAPPARAAAAKPRTESASVRTFRPTRKIPAIIASLLLFAGGTLVAAEVISTLMGRPSGLAFYDKVAEWARTTTWQDRAVIIGSSLMLALGLLLLLLAAVPGSPRLVALRTGDPTLVTGVSEHMLARIIGTAASRVDGVRRARAKVRGRHVTVFAETVLRATAPAEDRIGTAVRDELDKLEPVRPMSVRTRVRGVT
jgi:hypothetical protein